jgi:hypothetical protein
VTTSNVIAKPNTPSLKASTRALFIAPEETHHGAGARP